MLIAYGVLMNVSFYSAFLTGLYQHRTFEFSMKRVPVPLKLVISTAVSGAACRVLYNKQIYQPELYRMALKYRSSFDPEAIDRETEIRNYI